MRVFLVKKTLKAPYTVKSWQNADIPYAHLVSHPQTASKSPLANHVERHLKQASHCHKAV